MTAALTRRQVLGRGLAGAAALSVPLAARQALDRAAALPARRGAGLEDIEHVVILMQENRSFDHVFGTLAGVRGFGDPHALVNGGRSVFDQNDPDLAQNPSGHLLPLRALSKSLSAQCMADINHNWSAQHQSLDGGRMDSFVAAHRAGDPPTAAINTMSYYTRADLPFHYALADAFTVCDAYHCSALTLTNPNRIIAMSGTADPQGQRGGPCVDNDQSNGQLRWESYPEALQKAGVDWYVYQEADNDQNNMLPFFAGFADKSSDLYRRGNTVIPTPSGHYGPALAAKLKSDVLSGRLPQVSWILASTADCEHPPGSMASGARFTAGVLDALTADPQVWAKTVLFITYDENGGFFDHVPPPLAPPSEADEYYATSQALVPSPGDPVGPAFTEAEPGPVGLGFRVPMTIVSPFSTGGLVATDTFDHTSQLRFLAARFGVAVPNLSSWRRAVVGDLTSAFDFAASPTVSIPALPDAMALERQGAAECDANQPLDMPAAQQLPVQEPGARRGPRPGTPAPPAARSDSALRIALHGVPRRATRRAFRLRVRIEHSLALHQVRVVLDGRQMKKTGRASFALTIAPSDLRPGPNRLAVSAIDVAGHRASVSVIVRRRRGARARSGRGRS